MKYVEARPRDNCPSCQLMNPVLPEVNLNSPVKQKRIVKIISNTFIIISVPIYKAECLYVSEWVCFYIALTVCHHHGSACTELVRISCLEVIPWRQFRIDSRKSLYFNNAIKADRKRKLKLIISNAICLNYYGRVLIKTTTFWSHVYFSERVVNVWNSDVFVIRCYRFFHCYVIQAFHAIHVDLSGFCTGSV